jgi:hypothetical protein
MIASIMSQLILDWSSDSQSSDFQKGEAAHFRSEVILYTFLVSPLQSQQRLSMNRHGVY